MFVDYDVIGETAVAADLDDIGERARDMRPALRKVRDMLTRGHAKQFSSRGSYFGTPWAPLDPDTVDRKHSAEVLSATGALRASLLGGKGRKTSVTRSSVAVGTRVWYAGFHQHGTKHMPARPLVGSTDGQIRAAIWLLERWLAHGTGA